MIETPVDFCIQLVRAIQQDKKTRTHKPLTSENLADLRDDRAPVCPYGQVGDTLWVQEPWGTARGKLVYLADCVGDGFRDKIKYPVGYRIGPGPLPRESARVFLDITAISIIQLANTDEASAKLVVNAPSEGRTTYLDELKTQWATTYHGHLAWDANPLCWRIDFKRRTP